MLSNDSLWVVQLSFAIRDVPGTVNLSRYEPRRGLPKSDTMTFLLWGRRANAVSVFLSRVKSGHSWLSREVLPLLSAVHHPARLWGSPCGRNVLMTPYNNILGGRINGIFKARSVNMMKVVKSIGIMGLWVFSFSIHCSHRLYCKCSPCKEVTSDLANKKGKHWKK